MSYIGNPIVSTDFPVDYFSGNASTTAFTLSIAPASVNAVDVEVSGVSQSPQTYTLSGTTLTFSAAPPSGTNNIVIKHRGIAGVPNVPSVGSVVPASMSAGAPSWSSSGGVSLPRIDSSSEGGQLNFNRASDDTSTWSIDSYGSGSTPSLRILDGANVRASFDSSGNFLFNSGYGSAATAYGCRAWVNFNGSNGAINASGNVSSVTRNGTGDYSVNFTNAMPDANYAGTGMGRRNNATQRPVLMCMSSSATYNQFTTYARFYTMLNDSATIEDPIWFNYTVFR